LGVGLVDPGLGPELNPPPFLPKPKPPTSEKVTPPLASSNTEGASDELAEGLQATVGASNQMKLLHGASSNIEGASDELVQGLEATVRGFDPNKVVAWGPRTTWLRASKQI